MLVTNNIISASLTLWTHPIRTGQMTDPRISIIRSRRRSRKSKSRQRGSRAGGAGEAKAGKEDQEQEKMSR